MLIKFKESRDREEKLGAFCTNLSKAFDCIDHNLLITKLPWYGATAKSLSLFLSYLRHWTQCFKMDNI